VVCGTHLRLLAPWTTGCFRSECCTGGEPMAAPRVNRFLAPIHQRRARGWTGGKHCFSQLRYNPTGNRTLPSRFGRTLPTRFGRTLPTRFGRSCRRDLVEPCRRDLVEPCLRDSVEPCLRDLVAGAQPTVANLWLA